MKTKISPGNTKTGRIPAVSLPPISSCRPDAPCTKQCYAMKAFRMYPAVRVAWNSNLKHYESNPDAYFNDIHEWLQRKKKPCRFFRWHVSGDILNHGYYQGMCSIARSNPDTIFLAFTKQYSIVNSSIQVIPNNQTIVFSAWPGFPIDNPFDFPIAYMQDGTETRVNGDELTCPGNCETCGMCWQLPKIGRNVVFNIH